MTALSEQYRQKLRMAAAQVKPGKAALLLSGGLDSGSVLMACLDAGLAPDLFTLTYGDHLNEDARLAQLRAERLAPQLTFTVVHVPRTGAALEQVALRVIQQIGSLLKTSIEVMVMLYPFLDMMAEQRYTAVFHGMTGGNAWGLGKETMFEKARSGHAAWMQRRRVEFGYEYTSYPPISSRVFRQVCLERQMVYADPLEQIAPWLLTLTYDQLHKPKPKALALYAYPELSKVPYQQGGMQVTGGIREFAQLCAEERGYSSAVAWYNALARAQGVNPRGSPQGKQAWKTGKYAHVQYKPQGLGEENG
jgi:hypothetical protein